MEASLPQKLNLGVTLSEEQIFILDQIPDMPFGGRIIFVTGRAGTGKSTLLRALSAITPMKYAVLAPTGIAAINAGGQTIHSFFNFPLGPLDPETSEIPVFKVGGQKSKLIKELDLLIIDEVSMVRADLLDAIDVSLRRNRGRNEPFGGVTVVAFGDVWQLEPVVAGQAESEFLAHHYRSPFFFDSHIVRQVGMDVLELQTVHRQVTDPEFLWALDRLRVGDTGELNLFLDRVAQPLHSAALTLTTTNARANLINSTSLVKLPGSQRAYEAKIEGDFGKDLPADEILNLKPGAQVMFVKNSKQWVNGTLGHVTSVGDDEIKVQIVDGEEVTVAREIWEKNRFTWDRSKSRIVTEPIGSFVQFPLRLAWAVTIHKSQGLTFDRLILDLDRKAFAHGQMYVALSRCRTAAGLSLSRPIDPNEIFVHERVQEFAREAGLSTEA